MTWLHVTDACVCVLSLARYCAQQGLLPAVLQSAVLLGTLFAGRLLALVAELYFISR